MKLNKIGPVVAFVVMAILGGSSVASGGAEDSAFYIYDTAKCVNLYKPYKIVPKSDSLAFANFLDLQFDEVYARVREAICNAALGDCVIRADTIRQCHWLDTCSYTTTEGTKVVINSKILELLWGKPYPTTGQTDCLDDTMFIGFPVIRFRTRQGDSLDISGPDDLAFSNGSGVSHFEMVLPENNLPGMSIMRWSRDNSSVVPSANDTDNVNSSANARFYPISGLTQSGTWKNVNTNMTKDTIYFATSFTNKHGGVDSSGGILTTVNNYEHDAIGWKYFSSTSYTVNVDWGSGTSTFNSDSLWVDSKTDSSFVVGIQYSSTARTISFILHGRWKTLTP